MNCPKCRSGNCQIITEVKTTGKDYSASNGCCGYLLFGPIGMLCGLCAEGKQTTSVNYWVCHNCGHKFKL